MAVGALDAIARRLSFALMVVSIIGVMLSVLLSTADVVGTQLFLAPVHGATEGTTELMVILAFLSLPYVQRIRAHIRVELLYSHLSPRARTVLDVVAAAAGLLFFGLLLWQALGAARASWEMGESTLSVLRVPIYPAKFAIVGGVAVTMCQLVVDFVESARAAGRRDPR